MGALGTAVPVPESSHPVWSLARLRRPPKFALLNLARRRATTPGADPGAQNATSEYVFTHAELQPVLQAIRVRLACGPIPLDSPLRLQEALTTLVNGLGSRGDVSVRRSPAALMTPEYWQIVFAGLDAPTHATLAEMFRGARR
jgi:hypothetical protein